ncbi:5-formyltetrahydrofolate cyclo-ligase, partial [Modestobacter versicolor]
MSHPVESAVAKDALRADLLARRLARPAEERAAAAEAIVAALLRGLDGVGTLAAFVPEPDEPGAGLLPRGYAQLGARVLLPVVLPTGRLMDWAVDTGELETGRFGLLQPVGPRLGPEAIGAADAVVVPALAVD